MKFEKPKRFLQAGEITPNILRKYASASAKEQLIIQKTYSLVKKLKEGSFAEIFLIVKRDTHQSFVLKVVDYLKIKHQYSSLEATKLIKHLTQQYPLLKYCNSPFVVKCIEAFANQHCNCLVLEYCTGKTLREILIENDYCLDETTAVKIINHMIWGTRELSQKNIIHRDLNLQNVMESNGLYKIIDLGFGKQIKEAHQSQNHSIVGTRSMMAPEVIRRLPYGLKADIYSIGLILLKIVVHNYKFEQRTPRILDEKLLNKKEKPLNENILDFLRKTLEPNPDQRISQFNLVHHPLVYRQQQTLAQFKQPNDKQQTSSKTQTSKQQRSRTSYLTIKTLFIRNSMDSTEDFDIILQAQTAWVALKLIQELQKAFQDVTKHQQLLKLLFLLSQKAFADMQRVLKNLAVYDKNCTYIDCQQIQCTLTQASQKQSNYKKIVQKMINSKLYQMGKNLKTFIYKIFDQQKYVINKKQFAIFFNSQIFEIDQKEYLTLTTFYIKKTILLLPEHPFLSKWLAMYHRIIEIKVNQQSYKEELEKLLQMQQLQAQRGNE